MEPVIDPGHEPAAPPLHSRHRWWSNDVHVLDVGRMPVRQIVACLLTDSISAEEEISRQINVEERKAAAEI